MDSEYSISILHVDSCKWNYVKDYTQGSCSSSTYPEYTFKLDLISII